MSFNKHTAVIARIAVSVVGGMFLSGSAAFADPLGFAAPLQLSAPAVERALSEDDAADAPHASELAPQLRRQIVSYVTREAPGTIVIDTPGTYLYFVLGDGRAIRYGIGVGRDGFTWSGTQNIARKQPWPDWYPPEEMIQRQPYLPRMMSGGPGNPLGARAMYLGNTQYRIHGTNAPDTIGKRVSSGCIRMLNEDVIDLYERVPLGAKVVVLPMHPNTVAPSIRHERPAVRPTISAAPVTYRLN